MLTLKNNIKSNKNDFYSFNDLAIKVFDLSFESWWKNDYWQDKYFPYTLFDGKRAIANVSGSIINTLVDGKAKKYLQIGTVMTDPEWRNQGLSRRLMEQLLTDLAPACDGVYLYANSTVLDFYPKFGFVKADEYCFTGQLKPQKSDFELLPMDKSENVELFRKLYRFNNPFSARPMSDNFGLVMFYCGTVLKNSVYYSKQLNCVAVADYDDDIMICYDIFGMPNVGLNEILSSIDGNARKVKLGFMPKDQNGFDCQKLIQEDQLFVLSTKENMFQASQMCLPLLSHA